MVYTVTAVCGAHTHGYVLYIPFSGGRVSGIYTVGAVCAEYTV